MNKESIHDQRIAPLMTQIIDICKEGGIAMVASFYIPTPENPDLACTSALPDETGTNPPHLLRALDSIRGGGHSFAIVTSRKEQP